MAVSNFFNLRDRSSNSPTSFPLSLTCISATPCFASSTSYSEATARSANTAKLSNDALSECVAKWARIGVGICQIKAWRMTAFPTTAVVQNPAILCSRLRNRGGMSDHNCSPEITLLTVSGVVKPLRSINIPFRFSYLCVRKDWSNTSLTSDSTSPETAAQANLYFSSSFVICCKSNCVSIWLNHNSTSVE